jgi:hypothetical protein
VKDLVVPKMSKLDIEFLFGRYLTLLSSGEISFL